MPKAPSTPAMRQLNFRVPPATVAEIASIRSGMRLLSSDADAIRLALRYTARVIETEGAAKILEKLGEGD